MNGDTAPPDLEAIFGLQGPLAQSLAGYQLRPEQLEMARSVARAIDQQRHAVIEAPTGLGKSFAYLIPALLSGKQVIVATANKSLQNQLADKDVPDLLRLLDLNVPYTLAKGRSNYICHYKWHNYMGAFEETVAASRKEPLPVVQEITLGLETADFSGDIEYLDHPLPRGLAREIVSFPNDCIGTKCRFAHIHCYVDRMRQAAFQARLIITNHHLLLYSLKPQHEDQLLPQADVYVVDEAHNLEAAATLVFQTTIHSGSLRMLLEGKAFKAALGSQIAELEDHNRALFASLAESVSPDEPIQGDLAGFAEMGSRLEEAAAWMEGQPVRAELIPEQQAEAEAEHQTAVRALKTLHDDYQHMAIANPEYVRYKQIVPRGGVAFHRAPLQPAALLHPLLFEEAGRSVVCTSATLTTRNSFEHFRRQCGLRQDELDESQLPHIFDYGTQALLYQPPMPRYDFRRPEIYYAAAAEKIRSLLEITHGNTLCLFTSWRGLNMVFDILSAQGQDVVWPIRSQGEDVSRRDLLAWFQSTPHSVLCATRSFWEGIDVPGAALTSVVLDKLPFPNLRDPIHQQRMHLMDEAKATGDSPNAFVGYMLPHMALTLKQGFGRLIRRMDDQGVVTVLDTRLEDTRYGSAVRRQDLPPARYSRRLSDVFRFLAPRLYGRPVYGLNIPEAEAGEIPAQVELTVPQRGLRDRIGLSRPAGLDDPDHVMDWSLAASLQLLRQRIEAKGGCTAESVVQLRCPVQWARWASREDNRHSADLAREVACWRQVHWQGLDRHS